MSQPKLTVVSVEALSYSGTTWLNLVLGSHERAFTLGPPHRIWSLKDKCFEGANLVHGKNDTFWKDFDAFWDRKENFLLALARYRNATHIIFDNPSPEFRAEVMSHPDISVKTLRYLRDGRAIAASYARKNKSKAFVDTILPSGWLYHSFMNVRVDNTSDAVQVFKYEDCCDHPAAFLAKAGAFVGLEYSERSLRFWEFDHHITTGNQGTIALVKLAKGIPSGSFTGDEFYRQQFEEMKENPLGQLRDDRWKQDLRREDLYVFDRILGAKNQELGYARDRFNSVERLRLRQKFGNKLGNPIVDVHRLKSAAKRRLRPLVEKIAPQFLSDHKTAKQTVRPETNAAEKRTSDDAQQPQAKPLAAGPAPTTYTTGLKDCLYYDEADPMRLAALAPYRVADTGQSWGMASGNINSNFYIAYGPDYDRMPTGKIAVDPIIRYQQLLESLMKMPSARFVSAEDLVTRRPVGGELLVQLRHDVDGDLVAALEQARIEHRLSIVSSFYILHTAPYYGIWDPKRRVFARNDQVAAIYKEIQALGHEVSLHTDALFLYQSHDVDGAEAIRTEIAWLRAQDIRLIGSVSHNSVGTYGACNYAVFKNRPISFVGPAGPKAVTKDGRWAPLQVLDEAELGLVYEGNELFWQTDMRLEYACLMAQNSWFVQTFEGGKINPKTPEEKLSEWKTQDEVIDYVAKLPRPAAVMLSVHCMHYGFRPKAEAGPVVGATIANTAMERSSLGWLAHRPKTLLAAAGGKAEAPEYQSFIVTTPEGMLDIPIHKLPEAKQRLIFLGRENIHAPTVAVGSKITQHVARLGKQRLGLDMAATSLAGPAVNYSILAGWFNQFSKLHPGPWHTAVLSVGLDDLVLCDPGLFARLWGLGTADAAAACPEKIDQISLKKLASLAPDPGRVLDASPYRDPDLLRFLSTEPFTPARPRWHNTKNRLLEVIDYLKPKVSRVVLLVEDCGEKSGLWNDATPAAERQRLASIADILFREIADTRDAGYVNPYHAFNTYQGQGRTHWKTTNQWSIHGHGLAGDALLGRLVVDA